MGKLSSFTSREPRRTDATVCVRGFLRGARWLLFGLLGGCAAEPPKVPANPANVQTRAAPKPAAGSDDKQSGTRLVVSIVFDQLPSWAVERYWANLSEAGALRYGASRGMFYTHSRYGFATTQTAPGHASIYTGTSPSQHGVTANMIWDRGKRRLLAATDDGEHAVLGVPGAFASPKALRSETVADVLEKVSEGLSKTVSISLKDRAAVLSGGQRPDGVFWFDAKQPGFTTSTYYEKSLPLWLAAWQTVHPASGQIRPWVPQNPAQLESLLGPDSGPGEGDWESLGTAFPHDPGTSKNPYSAFRATPSSSSYLLEFARACIQQYDLGADETPDLLMVSISGTDYVGHIFGPESWEYLDNLVRTDEAVGKLVQELEALPGVRFLITSDHGVAPLPERARGRHPSAGRLLPVAVLSSLNQALVARGTLGEAPLLEAFEPPFLYLTEGARNGSNRDAIVLAVLEELTAVAGVQGGFDVRAVARSEGAVGLERQVAESVSLESPGDIYVVPAPHTVFDVNLPRGAGTNHGSPWPYDLEVPVLFWGSGVEQGRRSQFVEQSRVASTLSALLGIPAPKNSKAQALPGIAD